MSVDFRRRLLLFGGVLDGRPVRAPGDRGGRGHRPWRTRQSATAIRTPCASSGSRSTTAQTPDWVMPKAPNDRVGRGCALPCGQPRRRPSAPSRMPLLRTRTSVPWRHPGPKPVHPDSTVGNTKCPAIGIASPSIATPARRARARNVPPRPPSRTRMTAARDQNTQVGTKPATNSSAVTPSLNR